MPNSPKTGVGGTVDAFNFIRRVAFPSTPRILAIYAGTSLGFAVFSFLAVGESLSQSLVFAGAVLVSPGVIGELGNSVILLRKDRILDFRRLMGIEVVSVLLTGAILTLVSVIGAVLGTARLWVDGFLIGVVMSFPVRFLTPMAMSSVRTSRKLLAGIPTPILTILSFLILLPFLSSGQGPTAAQISALIMSGLVLSSLGVFFIIRRVEIEGTKEIHHSPMDLFRSFLDHWLRKNPTALEEKLLSLSSEGSIETKILGFFGRESRPKSTIVVSNFHPGPYRDMGSGGLSSEMKHFLEESKGGVVLVPHGISNHKLNIVSHQDITRLLTAARENYPGVGVIHRASSMIREREGEALVSGQAFGNVALLTITLAPEEMEDLPTEVSTTIDQEASKLGLEAVVIDAHNSLVGQTSITPAQAERIISAAVRVLGRLKDLSQGPFSVGSGYDALGNYGLNDGIGPGGLSVMAVRTVNGVVSYITIDGNNMQQGLRELIIQSIRQAGVNDGEVMTTDTHLVTGLVRSPLGYYPVGAAMPTEPFIAEIRQTVQTAVTNLEESSVGLSKFSLHLQVLGSEAFHSISGFIGRIARQIGRSFIFLEVATLVLAIVIVFVV